MTEPNKTSKEPQDELRQLRRKVVQLESARVSLRLAEAALKESEERFRAQYQALPLATYTWAKKGPDFALVDMNRAARAESGANPEQFIGQRARAIYPDRTDIVKDLLHCYESKKVVRRETVYVTRASGEKVDLILTYAFIPPNLIMMHSENITERKKAELALRESELLFRTVADFTYDWEYWRGPDGRFLYVSPSCFRVTGYRPADFLANPDFLESIIVPEDLQKFKKHRSARKQPGKGYQVDFSLRHRDGSISRIRQHSQVVYDSERGFMGIRASNRDLSEYLDEVSV